MLINLVLNSLPTYTLSFYKALSKVLKEILKFFSKLLWCGLDDKKPIHWVKWEQVCKSKECVKEKSDPKRSGIYKFLL